MFSPGSASSNSFTGVGEQVVGDTFGTVISLSLKVCISTFRFMI